MGHDSSRPSFASYAVVIKLHQVKSQREIQSGTFPFKRCIQKSLPDQDKHSSSSARESAERSREINQAVESRLISTI